MIVRADIGHAHYIGFHCRKEDAAEAFAIAGIDAEQAAARSFEASAEAWAWVRAWVPGAIWGVALESVIGGVAVPWLATTRLVDQHPIEFARGSRKVLADIRTRYPVLENYVDARYTKCVRWLRWLGFEIHPAEPYGQAGLPFHKFRMG